MSNSKKILHVFPSSHHGGSELCAMESIQALNDLGYENYAVIPTHGVVLDRLKNIVSGVEVVSYDWWVTSKAWSFWLKLKMIFGFYKSSRKISKLINQYDIDLVITHTLTFPSAALAASKSKVSHVWYIHEYGLDDHGLKFEYGKYSSLKFINIFSDAVIVNSKALQNYYSSYFDDNKLRLLYYAVDYPNISPLINKEKDSLKICMVGRIAPGKNQLTSLNALAYLHSFQVFPTIDFVGSWDEEYKNELISFIDKNNLTNQVRFVGQVNHPWEYVSTSDVVLVCSYNEAFGRVTVEGMKAGRVVVASSTGAGFELLDGEPERGFLFEPNDFKGLADILKHVWSSSEVKEITSNAQQYAWSNFSLPKHGKDLGYIIDSVL